MACAAEPPCEARCERVLEEDRLALAPAVRAEEAVVDEAPAAAPRERSYNEEETVRPPSRGGKSEPGPFGSSERVSSSSSGALWPLIGSVDWG
jgi:hypothetical protein